MILELRPTVRHPERVPQRGPVGKGSLKQCFLKTFKIQGILLRLGGSE